MQPEAKLKLKLKKHFEKVLPDVYWQNNSQGRFSTAGTPDIEMCYNGKVCYVEIKMPTGVVSKLQEICHDKIRQAGGKVFTIYGYDEDLIAEIEGWLRWKSVS